MTGTRDGITATQMDIKCDGLSYEVLEKALNQAREGRMHILNIITDTIAEPRADLKPHAPRLETMIIPKEMIGAVIGPGGKIIQSIQEASGAIVTIDESTTRATSKISAANLESIQDAKRRIKAITAQPEEGETYTGVVKSILPFGAFRRDSPRQRWSAPHLGNQLGPSRDDGDLGYPRRRRSNGETHRNRQEDRQIPSLDESSVAPVPPERAPRNDRHRDNKKQ